MGAAYCEDFRDFVSVPALGQEEFGLEEALIYGPGFAVPSSYEVDDFDCSYDEDRDDDDGVVDLDDEDADNSGIVDTF